MTVDEIGIDDISVVNEECAFKGVFDYETFLSFDLIRRPSTSLK